ncbi:TRAF-like protein [Tanacetum coccineum]|uniref:TRAF-like protein n=1 Tax=Tanacetum coccineum TaxID=301880 RepID=A0ABQ4X7Z8_9ASTR
MVWAVCREFGFDIHFWCCRVMGRNKKDDLTAGRIFYACVQCVDMLFVKVALASDAGPFIGKVRDARLGTYGYCKILKKTVKTGQSRTRDVIECAKAGECYQRKKFKVSAFIIALHEAYCRRHNAVCQHEVCGIVLRTEEVQGEVRRKEELKCQKVNLAVVGPKVRVGCYDVKRLAKTLKDSSLNFKHSSVEKATGSSDESN